MIVQIIRLHFKVKGFDFKSWLRVNLPEQATEPKLLASLIVRWVLVMVWDTFHSKGIFWDAVTNQTAQFSRKLTNLVSVIYFFTRSEVFSWNYLVLEVFDQLQYITQKKVCFAIGAATIVIFNKGIKPIVIKTLLVCQIDYRHQQWMRQRDRQKINKAMSFTDEC